MAKRQVRQVGEITRMIPGYLAKFFVEGDASGVRHKPAIYHRNHVSNLVATLVVVNRRIIFEDSNCTKAYPYSVSSLSIRSRKIEHSCNRLKFKLNIY